MAVYIYCIRENYRYQSSITGQEFENEWFKLAVVKFDGKKAVRCYAVAFDYDEWQYTINNTKKRQLPAGVEAITVEVERE